MLNILIPATPEDLGFAEWFKLAKDVIAGQPSVEENMLEIRVTFFLEEQNPDVALWTSEIIGALVAEGVLKESQVVWLFSRALPNLPRYEPRTTIQIKEYWANGRRNRWSRRHEAGR